MPDLCITGEDVKHGGTDLLQGLSLSPELCEPPVHSAPVQTWKSRVTPRRVRLAAEFSLAGTKMPCVSGAAWNDEEETQKSKSQSAVGEEWEVRKNKKQQIKVIIRGTQTKSAVLNCVDSSKEQRKLPSHRLAADSRQEGRADMLRKPVWASGRAFQGCGWC